MPDADDRFAALEGRIAALEARLNGADGRPLPAAPKDIAELRPWLLRLHEAVTDLAADQADLHGQIGQIVGVLEGVDDPPSGDEPVRSVWSTTPSPGAAQRLAKAGVAAARRARSLAKRALQSSAPADWIHRVPSSTAPARL
ncbi:MAG: hypothetical protein AAGF23_13605, partial [Acidobacteriota bacterium]